VYFASGNDSRATAPFMITGLRDEGNDTDVTSPPTSFLEETAVGPGGLKLKIYTPAVPLEQTTGDSATFSQQLEAQFRGTLQPAAGFLDPNTGVAFFGATRFNALSPTRCRSTFDTTIYAKNATTGGAVYDLSTGDDTFVLLEGSRKTALQFTMQPTPEGTVSAQLRLDEGIVGAGGNVEPPPPSQAPAVTPVWPSVGYATGTPFPQMSNPRCLQ
jgi:hypothetical protein